MDIDNSVWWDEIVVTLRVDLARGPDDATKKKKGKDKEKSSFDGASTGTGTWEVGEYFLLWFILLAILVS